MLTMRQIEAFQAVMTTNNMTEAAKLLSVTQSAVSKIMSELEAEVGFRLFTRRKGGLEPSPEARTLYHEVQRGYEGLGRISRTAERIRRGEGGQLRIAAMPALTSGFLQKVIAKLKEANHYPEIVIDTYNSPEVIDLVSAGHYDIGFSMTPIDKKRVNTGTVISSLCVCILHPNDSLNRKEIISIEDLSEQSFISLAKETTTRLQIDSLFASKNIWRDIKFESLWALSVAAFVKEGLGCSIIDPFSASSLNKNDILIKPLHELITFTFAEISPKISIDSIYKKTFLRFFYEEVSQFQIH